MKNALLLTDYYKTEHFRQYPKNTTMIYSNFTARKSRISGIDEVVFFGLQHFCLEYLIKEFNESFFIQPKIEIIEQYKKHIHLSDYSHIESLHDLGYLPIEIKAIPEGSLVPIGVPCFTIKNTHPEFGWLTNYLETLISCMVWQPITSATIAYQYKKLLSKYAKETIGSDEGVQWQGHDFSMRGMSSVESAILSAMGHLLSFIGTDTIPAIYQLEDSYNATGLVGASVPATEHSVMCMGQKEDEIETFKRLLSLYPNGILSVVSDTWDLWKVCTEFLPELKDQILSRDGKLVIRPDSGDPVDIICGEQIESFKSILDAEIWYRYVGLKSVNVFYIDDKAYKVEFHSGQEFKSKQIECNPSHKGVIELLWDTFGGTINEQGYKVLDSHIGAIYGDSITLERAEQICERLKAKGFASTNIVLGIGSYTYQHNTRDTFGFAMKATYGEVMELAEVDDYGNSGYHVDCRQIFKDPITDDGTKRSKKGLLMVQKNTVTGKLECIDQVDWETESKGELKTIFKDSKLTIKQSLSEIRERLNKYDYFR